MTSFHVDKMWRASSLRFALTVFMVFGFVAAFGSIARGQAFSEGFAVVPVPGWTTQNNSVPVGTTGWFQGTPATFPAQAGATNSYIAANFNNTTGTNTISNWLISPNRTFSNGDVIRFWTRTPAASPWPDRLQVRFSSAGVSTNVGTGPTGVGDFTTVLIDINPTYNVPGGPPPANYPQVWTEVTLTLSGLAGPTSGRIAFRYFVELGGPLGANSNYIGIDTFSYTPVDAPVDFNGDGKTDFSVVRNTGGGPSGQITWFNQQNGSGAITGFLWGIATDFFISGDYDGDGKDDIVVWRSGAATVASYYILNSATSTLRQEAFGQTGDDPSVVGDYNNDGRDDLAVYRTGAQSIWFYRTVANGPVFYVPWGTSGDFPAPGDYDGNGSADFSIQRDNGGGQARFWTLLSTGATTQTVFGTPTDVVVPGDYDGDGKTDIATIRGSGGSINWYVLPSSTGVVTATPFAVFGVSATDLPTQGDYDGDGKTDVAIWRPSATPGASQFWYRNTTGGAVTAVSWGNNGDYPVANFNIH